MLDRFLNAILALSLLFLVVSNYCEIKILLGFNTTYCTGANDAMLQRRVGQ